LIFLPVSKRDGKEGSSQAGLKMALLVPEFTVLLSAIVVANLKVQKAARYKSFIEKYGQIFEFLTWHVVSIFKR
jgi:3-methyladenine DNA glycosylase/8-oxoguanine DNA glycosylase